MSRRSCVPRVPDRKEFGQGGRFPRTLHVVNGEYPDADSQSKSDALRVCVAGQSARYYTKAYRFFMYCS